MKRLIPILAAMAMAAPFALTHAESVTSVNAVGMVRISIAPNQLTFVSLPFVTAGSGLDEVIGNQLTGGGNSGTSDRIIVFNEQTQSYTAYWKVSGTGTSFDGKWHIDDEVFPPNPENANIQTGVGFWVESRNSAAQDLIISGEVPSEVVEITLPEGLKQIGFPYPVELDVNSPNFDINQVATGAGNSGSSDRLIFWNADAQSYVPLWLVDGTGNETFDGFWHYDDETFPPTRAEITVKPGMGFWFERRNSQSIDWGSPKPYPWP
ncbi:MAG: hypothetical protein JJU29_23985 [Verrucomicrobia bacterium]|nr:hypothetical protein [Verrucomicrobiota bacterium]MCH8513156.1 hypothetical protein [Kiritimatiellia bacterium]